MPSLTAATFSEFRDYFDAGLDKRDADHIDACSTKQGEIYTAYRRAADEHDIDPEPVPHIHDDHGKSARRCGITIWFSRAVGTLVGFGWSDVGNEHSMPISVGAVLLYVTVATTLDVSLGRVGSRTNNTTGPAAYGSGSLAIPADRRWEGVLSNGGRSPGYANEPYRGGGTVADIVKCTSEKELADLIFQHGEERRSRKIARAIVRARPIMTTAQSAKLMEQTVPRTGRLHPATQTFMALRLVVNREMEELEQVLKSLPRLVRPGGRVVFLTFMSTEDRKVKKSFQALAREGRAVALTSKPLGKTESEIREKLNLNQQDLCAAAQRLRRSAKKAREERRYV